MSPPPGPSGPGRPGVPALLRRLLARLLPRERVDDVLGDLTESIEARPPGRAEARRRLRREVAGLALWRLRSAIAGRGDRQGVDDRAGKKTTGIARDLLQDLGYGLRGLARRPAFALTAIGVMALGIAAPATVLTLVDRIFFERPAHVAEPHRVVALYRTFQDGTAGGSLGNPDYEYYRDNATTLAGLAASGGRGDATFSAGGRAVDQLEWTCVSESYFSVLGVEPLLGRFFLPEENRTPGTHPVAVLSHRFWRRAYGADPDIVGSTLVLNGTAFDVVGVAPDGFRGVTPFGVPPDVWVPIAMYGALTRASNTGWWERHPNLRINWLTAVGRLAPGVTYEAARDNLVALSDALEYEGRQEGEGLMVSRQYLYRPAQAVQLAALSGMLLAAVAIVLAVAAANAAVLLLSRATTRGREIGIRAALGAGRGRIFRQLLAESLLLGGAGGALGIALAYATADLAASLLPYAFATSFTPSAEVLAIAALLSIVVALLAGLAPALVATRPDVARVIDDARVAGSRSRTRDTLVVGQVALSLVLVAGALLFGRSFWTARAEDLGWQERNRLVVSVDLQSQGYEDDEGRTFVRQALDRIVRLPGVEAVTTTYMIPFRGDWSTDFDPAPDRFPDAPDGPVWIGLNVVGPDYFEIMGIPVVRGRPLGAGDHEGSEPALVINETLARTLWPGVDPLGRTIALIADRDFTVVGVARDATYYALGEEPVAQAYGSLYQVFEPSVRFLVATAGEPTGLVPAVRDALRSIDSALPVGDATTLESVVDEQSARYEVSAILVGLFGSLALALTAAGLYGTVSFLVAQRTREIGVRMALGAGRGRVARQVLRDGTRLAAAGIVLGAGGALLARRVTESMLYGVEPADPWSLAGACVTLVAVATLATIAPARRATRVDPVEAIRAD